jgi:dTDP-4-amino-4,6-dideoxygalactose transaminase
LENPSRRSAVAETNIPLVDLKWQRDQIRDEVLAGWAQVLDSTSFILGPAVGEFESAFANYSGVDHCIGVGNGTDALEMAIRALGVGPGDEVILPANTFIATALAVTRVGATPVLVDCDPDTYLITPDLIAPAVGPRTKAVIPVHLYGQMAPVGEIMEAFPSLWVVEDGAQSQGASRNGRASGSVGHIAATSFYPGKNIGAYGDAGAVLTNDPDLADQVRKLRNWGGDVKYHHPEKGFNSRMDSIQAVVLSAKLRRLDDWNKLRSEAADYYTDNLASVGVTLPEVSEGNHHVWHLYVLQVEERDEVLKHLNADGVGAGIHYPIPIHLQGAYRELGQGSGSFPSSERLASRALSLPIFPGVTVSTLQRVVASLSEIVG